MTRLAFARWLCLTLVAGCAEPTSELAHPTAAVVDLRASATSVAATAPSTSPSTSTTASVATATALAATSGDASMPGPAPGDPCLVGDLALAKVPTECDCDAPRSARPCPPPHGGQNVKIEGLEVSLTLEARDVRAGATVKAVLRYHNPTSAPLPLRFHRDTPPALGLRAENGDRLPIEGQDRCAIGGMVSMASLRGVWLAPGGSIDAPMEISARRERRVNGGRGEFDCDTEPGSPLAPGRYRLVLETSPLFATAEPAPVTFTVVR